jgi:hypothetical protein
MAKVLWDIKCQKCGAIEEIFLEGEPGKCQCGGKRERVYNNTNQAIWYTECPTASGGCAGNRSRVYGFVDDRGGEHKIKYHHGAPVKNKYKTGDYAD